MEDGIRGHCQDWQHAEFIEAKQLKSLRDEMTTGELTETRRLLAK
jgi:hypothetical protein